MLRLVKFRIWVSVAASLLCLQVTTKPVLVISPNSQGYYIDVVAAMATKEKLYLIIEERASDRSMEGLTYTIEAWPLQATKGPIWRKNLSTFSGIKDSLPSDIDHVEPRTPQWFMVEKEGSLFLLYDQSIIIGSTSQLIYKLDEKGTIIDSKNLGVDEALFASEAFPRPYYKVVGLHSAPQGLAIIYSSGNVTYINQSLEQITSWNPSSTSVGATLYEVVASDVDGDNVFVLGSTSRIPFETAFDTTIDPKDAFRISIWTRRHTLGPTISSDFQSDVGTISQPMNTPTFDILVKGNHIIVVGVYDTQEWGICKLVKISPAKPTCTTMTLSDEISQHVVPVWIGIPPNIAEISNGYVWNMFPIPQRPPNMKYAFLIGSHLAAINTLQDVGITLDEGTGSKIGSLPLLVDNGDDAFAIFSVGMTLADHPSYSIEVHKISLDP